MNSISTSRIVVGIGLAAVFGIGVSELAVHARQERQSQFALNAPNPATADSSGQNGADAAAPPLSAATQGAADQTAIPSSAPPAAPPVVAPVTGIVSRGDSATLAGNESKAAKPKRSDRASRSVARNASTDEALVIPAAATASSTTSHAGETASSKADSVTGNQEPVPAPSSSGATPAATPGTTADAQQAIAQTAPGTAASATPAATNNVPVASDSQITASVKSEIATAAPNSRIDVMTTNGVVALAGSVPTQDAAAQAREAALRVAGVKYVDASALMVGNQ